MATFGIVAKLVGLTLLVGADGVKFQAKKSRSVDDHALTFLGLNRYGSVTTVKMVPRPQFCFHLPYPSSGSDKDLSDSDEIFRPLLVELLPSSGGGWFNFYSSKQLPKGDYCCEGKPPIESNLVSPTCWQIASMQAISQKHPPAPQPSASKKTIFVETSSVPEQDWPTEFTQILNTETNALLVFSKATAHQIKKTNAVLCACHANIGGDELNTCMLSVHNHAEPWGDRNALAFVETGMHGMLLELLPHATRRQRAMAAALLQQTGAVKNSNSAKAMTFPSTNQPANQASQQSDCRWSFTLLQSSPSTQVDGISQEVMQVRLPAIRLDSDSHELFHMASPTGGMEVGDYCCASKPPVPDQISSDVVVTMGSCWLTAVLTEGHDDMFGASLFQEGKDEMYSAQLFQRMAFHETILVSIDNARWQQGIDEVIENIMQDSSKLYLLEKEYDVQYVKKRLTEAQRTNLGNCVARKRRRAGSRCRL